MWLITLALVGILYYFVLFPIFQTCTSQSGSALACTHWLIR